MREILNDFYRIQRETHLKLRHKVARETGLGGLEQML